MTESYSIRGVSIIGLGKLGLPIAACCASKGYNVMGVDTNPETVRLVKQGVTPVFEPGLSDLLSAVLSNLEVTHRYEEAVSGSNITFIVVPTPRDEHGGFSLQLVLKACEKIGMVLRKKTSYHLVVVTSTVMPGSTEHEVKSKLEASSNKLCGLEFGLCYSPEFVALGSVIRDFLNPDFFLIGESDPKAGDLLASFYRTICDNNCPIARMNIVNAELAKLAVNTFVTTKITFANMLAHICERLPGASVDVVTSALGLDGRIGPKYLSGAVGYGGPCFPRDNIALSHLARQLGVQARLAEATDRANREEVTRLAEIVKARLPVNGTVGILGLAYKPNTDVVEESQGLLLAQVLLEDGISTVVFDPMAMVNAREVLKPLTTFASSVNDCVSRADVIVIATPWEDFKEIPIVTMMRQSPPRVLIDCWRILERERYETVCTYVPLGLNSESVTV